jgi:hypothetical protein
VGLAFLASNYVYHVGPLFRQHMFMVMFETVAVVYLARTVEKEEADGRLRNKRLFGVMILLLLLVTRSNWPMPRLRPSSSFSFCASPGGPSPGRFPLRR